MAKVQIKTVTDKGSFKDVIEEATPEVKKISRAARALLADIMPGLTQVPWPHQKIAGFGVGPKKMSEQFCYIAPQSKHVNLGFYYGADLDDPKGLLEGTGKLLRHVKLRTVEEVQTQALRRLVIAASQHLPKLK